MISNEINFFLVILIYGALVLLAFLLIANPLKVNKKANFWIGLFLFMWSTFWQEEILELTAISLNNSIVIVGIRFLQFLTPLFFYLGISYYTNPDFKLKKTVLWYLPFSLIIFAGLVVQEFNRDILFLGKLLTLITILQAFYFVAISYRRIERHKKKIELFSSNTMEINLNWLEHIIIALFILVVFIGIYNLLFVAAYLNLFANIISLVIVYFIAYKTLNQKEIFLLNENQRNLVIKANEELVTTKAKYISDEDLGSLKEKVLNIMEGNKPFLDPELSLVGLAELVEITPHQLSYVLNKGFNKNFYLFVNNYRVEKVKEQLTNTKNSHLSIMGIAFEAGFNSKTSFNTTFKKITNQTPSEFKKRSSSL